MKFIVRPRLHAYVHERLWHEGEEVDLPWITEEAYAKAKKAKARDLCPWGIPAESAEAKKVRDDIVRRLRGEGKSEASYGEDARVRTEALLEQMNKGVPASDLA